MTFPYYTGKIEEPSEKSVKLPVSISRDKVKPEGYLPDEGLIAACNVALVLGQPLLLTGEPGTGKTQFAYHLAAALSARDKTVSSELIRFDTKSTSVAKDLFYSYDALRRLQDVQMQEPKAQDSKNYITYEALGLAILQTRESNYIENFVTGDKHATLQRSVVLIDEIDKASRDFPNDLLNELESSYFRVPEIGNDNKIESNPDLVPIIIITSNSEKGLPEPFLRRCVYYHIPFPKEDDLTKIITNRLDAITKLNKGFVKDALKIFFDLRKAQLVKKPSVAELLDWLLAMKKLDKSKNPLAKAEKKELIENTLSTLIKIKDDRDKVRRQVLDLYEKK